MKILSIRNIPSSHGRENVFKNSSFNSLLFTFVTFFSALGCFLLAHEGGYYGHGWSFPSGLLYWIGGVVGIMAMIGAFHYRARLRPSNWLVRLRPDQMLVKFRSHLNDHFNEEDPVVAAIPFAEIAWVRKTRERLMTPSSSDTHTTQVSWHTYLDVKLNSPETEELKETLTTERNRPAPKSREDELKHQLFQARKQKVSEAEISVIKESLKTERARKKPKMRGSGTRHHHYPVRMADSEILRVEWGGVKPKIKSILKMLNGKVHVEPELYLKTDHTLTPAENDMDSRILDLAERGKIMDAISMVRQQYGFSLTRSKEFVEELKKS